MTGDGDASSGSDDVLPRLFLIFASVVHHAVGRIMYIHRERYECYEDCGSIFMAHQPAKMVIGKRRTRPWTIRGL